MKGHGGRERAARDWAGWAFARLGSVHDLPAVGSAETRVAALIIAAQARFGLAGVVLHPGLHGLPRSLAVAAVGCKES